MKYENPELEVIMFRVEEVIRTSNPSGSQTKDEEDDYDFGG